VAIRDLTTLEASRDLITLEASRDLIIPAARDLTIQLQRERRARHAPPAHQPEATAAARAVEVAATAAAPAAEVLMAEAADILAEATANPFKLYSRVNLIPFIRTQS
jgi:hypothetical protein